MRINKVILYGIHIIFFVGVFVFVVYNYMLVTANAQDESESISDSSSQYDYSQIDEYIDKYMDGRYSFADIMAETTDDKNGNISFKGIIKTCVNSIESNRYFLIQITALILLSAVVNSFALTDNFRQLSDTANMIISLSMLTILFTVFYGAYKTASETIEIITGFGKSVCPIFFPAVATSCGSVSSAAYYQIILMMITVVNVFFKDILLKVNNAFLLLGFADNINNEIHFEGACGFINKVIKMSGKIILVFFLGLNGVKSLICPVKDSVKMTYLCKAMELVPGIGSYASTISKTVIGTSVLIKNSIGVAIIVIIFSFSIVPVVKLLLLSSIYYALSAVLEPVADKHVIRCVHILAEALSNLMFIVVISILLFIISIAIICFATNISL